MGNDNLIEIPVSVSMGELFKPDEIRTVKGGGTRLVKMVPLDNEGKTKLPCIWRSHTVTEGTSGDGSKIKVNACLLLAAKNPPTVLPADVAVDAWQHFSDGPVEW
jgi:hypothetical protein